MRDAVGHLESLIEEHESVCSPKSRDRRELERSLWNRFTEFDTLFPYTMYLDVWRRIDLQQPAFTIPLAMWAESRVKARLLGNLGRHPMAEMAEMDSETVERQLPGTLNDRLNLSSGCEGREICDPRFGSEKCDAAGRIEPDRREWTRERRRSYTRDRDYESATYG